MIANPPWDVVKPNGKEFLQSFAPTISKNNMTIKDFEKEKGKLLADPAIRAEWLAYQSGYPHLNAYFRRSEQFSSQTSVVNGKTAGTDLNLYKLFLEQTFRLLRDSGECGIVIPSGIYTDLGAKGLRELLFGKTEVTGLFCFENGSSNGVIFENVHRSFKFVVLSFRKGGETNDFPAAFMRHDVRDLKDFPGGIGMTLNMDLVRRLSPDSLSVMEFKSELDAEIAEKMLRFPLLGERLDEAWNLKLARELHMTDDSHMFRSEQKPGRLPLFEGKMIHQFRHDFATPKYWIDEKEGRAGLLKRNEIESGQIMHYQGYRLGFRDIAASTNERTLIATALPANVLLGNTINYSASLEDSNLLFLVGALNSFTADWVMRQKISSHVNQFYFYQLPIPG
ncbi:Eco57I restriction-modification methylase domain-containing protein [Deinococcus marmoris]|uniref:Eco57I restriction-modification methylase domain-containing protein n=1 Tax=Deinococcus marmoris TaxID=249408 RepID=UPI0011153BED|nr:hypothetical protein [Deinococcus marmoris]